MSILNGIATVGPFPNNAPIYSVNVQFQAALPLPPTVVANALQGSDAPGQLSDVFTVTIESVTTTGFRAHINRLDVRPGAGWGQNLRLSWMAFVPDAQNGIAPVGAYPPQAPSCTIGVQFPVPFAQPPVVVANALQDSTYPGQIGDTFAVSIESVTTTGFRAKINRTDYITGAGWGQNLRLSWMAALPNPLNGIAQVGPYPPQAPTCCTIGVQFPVPFPQPPVILANALQGTDYPGQISDTFAVSIESVSTTGFRAKITRTDYLLGAGWGQNLRLSWMASLPDLLGGVAPVGAFPNGAPSCSVSVQFPAALPQAPVVLASALQDANYPGVVRDVFAVSIELVSTTGFRAKISRTDVAAGAGWGQNLQLCWRAMLPDAQGGAAAVGPYAPGLPTCSVNVTFPKPQAQAPIVLANALQDAAYPVPIGDTFAVSIDAVTTTGFRANITRTDAPLGAGWGQNLRLSWLAVVPGPLAGVATLGGTDPGPTSYAYSVPFDADLGQVPTVVAVPLQGLDHPEQITDTFAVSITSVTSTGFRVNVTRTDTNPGYGWGQILRLAWVAQLSRSAAPPVTMTTDYTNWMSSIPNIDTKNLSDLCLPRSHDSATYSLSDTLAPTSVLYEFGFLQYLYPKLDVDYLLNAISMNVPGYVREILKAGVPPLQSTVNAVVLDAARSWSQATGLTVGRQLTAGVRWFDLRVCMSNGKAHAFHGLVGPLMDEVLSDVAAFLARAGRELVILDLSHMANLTATDHAALTQLIEDKLSTYLYPYPYSTAPDTDFTRLPMQTLTTLDSGARTSRVVVLYDCGDDDLQTGYNKYRDDRFKAGKLVQIWPSRPYKTPLAEDAAGNDMTGLITSIDQIGTCQNSFLAGYTPKAKQLCRLDFARTPDLQDLLPSIAVSILDTLQMFTLFAGSKQSLRTQAIAANSRLLAFLKQLSPQNRLKINLISLDFVEYSYATYLAIAISKGDQAAIDNPIGLPPLPASDFDVHKKYTRSYGHVGLPHIDTHGDTQVPPGHVDSAIIPHADSSGSHSDADCWLFHVDSTPHFDTPSSGHIDQSPMHVDSPHGDIAHQDVDLHIDVN